VDEIAAAREARREELALGLASEAQTLLRTPDPSPAALLRLASLVMDGWKLRRGIDVGSKQQGRGLFTVMAASEPELAGLLRGALPIHTASRGALARAAGLVFAPAP
ncbi:MAG TPA: hypothetical protein VF665_04595, partial [Longimicrobium sp.]|uniref:hypothetical protein n=1 Tax=Longimicrobium sp. TaxID=2029185 RepID=UPI002EDB2D81